MLIRFCNTYGAAVTRLPHSGSHTVKVRCSKVEHTVNRETKTMLVLIENYLSQAGVRLYDEDGQGLIEYVLIGALISIAAIAAMILVGPAIIARFTEITAAID